MKPLQKSFMNFFINFFKVNCFEVYLEKMVPIFKNIKNISKYFYF